MELTHDIWQEVRKEWRKCLPIASVATVSEDGIPHLAPVGSLLLNDDMTGFFFQIFLNQSGQNLENNASLCAMWVKSSPAFWLKSLWRGEFDSPPALRLVGSAGQRRASTERERQRWLKRVRMVRRLKGHDKLWGSLNYVREVRFERVVPVRIGSMTKKDWPIRTPQHSP